MGDGQWNYAPCLRESGGVSVPAAQIQKMKLLYLMKILTERSDEEHPLTAAELCRILTQEYDVPAERKSVYRDIAALQESGMDIEQRTDGVPGYYLGSRLFELAELKLLVDAVQASRSITGKKTDELIHKLESLASRPRQRMRRFITMWTISIRRSIRMSRSAFNIQNGQAGRRSV